MHADFEVYGGAMGLSSCCLYGGAPYNTQEIKLRRGVDIVIGTPGRVKVIAVIRVDYMLLLSYFLNECKYLKYPEGFTFCVEDEC